VTWCNVRAVGWLAVAGGWVSVWHSAVCMSAAEPWLPHYLIKRITLLFNSTLLRSCWNIPNILSNLLYGAFLEGLQGTRTLISVQFAWREDEPRCAQWGIALLDHFPVARRIMFEAFRWVKEAILWSESTLLQLGSQKKSQSEATLQCYHHQRHWEVLFSLMNAYLALAAQTEASCSRRMYCSMLTATFFICYKQCITSYLHFGFNCTIEATGTGEK